MGKLFCPRARPKSALCHGWPCGDVSVTHPTTVKADTFDLQADPASGFSQVAHLVQSAAHSAECSFAVFYSIADGQCRPVSMFGVGHHEAPSDNTLLQCAARLNPGDLHIWNDVAHHPNVKERDADLFGEHSPRVRFVAVASVSPSRMEGRGLLVVADSKPHAGLSAAKFHVLRTHAAQISAMLDLQAFRGATNGPESTAPDYASERLRLLESVVVNANDAVLITEAEPVQLPGPRIVYCNAAFTRTTGYSEEEVLGKTPRLLQTEKTDQQALDRLRRALERWKPVEVELLNRRKDGTEFWVELSIVPVANEKGWFTHWVSVQRDVSDRKVIEETATRARIAEAENLVLEAEIRERKRVEAELLYTAFHDDLTKLRNRAFFMDSLSVALGRMESDPRYKFAVLFMDLDRFKLVNDSLGHRAGDLLLMEVAGRLRTCIRPQDTLARVGGDEFALLVETVDETTSIVAISERLIAAMRPPVWLGDQEIFTSCSVGAVQASDRYQRPEELLRDADIAMYQAKRHDTGRYALFTDSMHSSAVEALELQTALKNAVVRNEFVLHYQPICDALSQEITGFEALVRWQHPQRGLVQPVAFIGVAEETGLIRDIGHWVLREACMQMQDWHVRFPELPLRLSVNTSAEELKDVRFTDGLRDVLTSTGLDPRTLQLEITESIFIQRPDVIDAILSGIRSLGVRIALDDFGTGYSSLSYLDRYQIDTLKIDRSFVARMLTPGRTMAIVNTIVRLGHELDLDIVAEGVEDAAQLRALLAPGCGSVQGYFLGRPMPVEQVEKLLASHVGARSRIAAE